MTDVYYSEDDETDVDYLQLDLFDGGVEGKPWLAKRGTDIDNEKKGAFRCNVCKKDFDSRCSRNEHIQGEHPGL